MNLTPWLIALISDASDYVLAPLLIIPIAGWITYELIGDIVDLITVFMLRRYIGGYAYIGASELLPAWDLLPIFTLSVAAWQLSGARKAS